MKRLLLGFHLVAGLVFTVIVWLVFDKLSALSFAAGAGTSWLNLLGLSIAWPRILAKKQVALAISVIVFKFAILGWILFAVVQGNTLSVPWFSVGLGLVILSVVVVGLRTANEPT